MVVAAKKTSQVITHLAIAFVITYAVTGSMLIGGLALLIEPVINVLLLPIHEKAWSAIRARARDERERYMRIAAEKVSQTALHMIVAFGVMYLATGSLAFGGMAAVGILQEGRPPGPRVVARARAFDLDHFGAQIGKQLTCPRRGKDTTQIEHLQVR